MRPRAGLVCVSGACSRSGKTALAVTLLQALPRGAATAVKFTTTEDVFERCPRGTPCVVCDIDVPYRVVEDEAVLRQSGTDTDRLAAAGARKVVWAIARASAVEAAWDAVLRRLDGACPAVIEGSTIVATARPELLCFVLHPFLSPARWKPTSPSLIGRADAVIVNVPAAERRSPAAAVLAEVERHRGPAGVRLADVTRPLGDWAPDLLLRLERLREAPLGAGAIA
jgi:hypothetical protein